MKYRAIIFILAVFCFLPILAHASAHQTADDLVQKMTIDLNLTPAQASIVKPIIEDSMAERRLILQNSEDKGLIKGKLDQLDQEENQKLAQVLNQDQMNKWVERQNLKRMLNGDEMDSGSEQKGNRHGRHEGGGAVGM